MRGLPGRRAPSGHHGASDHCDSLGRRSLLSGVGSSLVGTTLAGAVAGCLDDRPATDDPTLGAPEPFHEVTLHRDEDGGRFDPPIVHLVDGGTVEWAVVSGTHDVAAYHPSTHGEEQRIPDDAEPWASDRLHMDGDTFVRPFDTEGVYDVCCTVHESEGMVGSVVVGWPAPDDEPGLRPPDGPPDGAVDVLSRQNDRVRALLEEAHGER